MQDHSCYKNLKLLWVLRNIAMLGQAMAILIVTQGLHIPLQTNTLWSIIAALACINVFTWWRIRHTNRIRETEFFLQLMADIIALFGLLYCTGGATNPFASLFILQVIIAAIALSPIYTWITACITIALYTSLMVWNVNVPHFSHHGMTDFFSLHVQGMWISFILLAGIVAWFVVRMNRIIRRQDALLAEAEKIAAIGTLAASAAHELGTPLATLTILAEDYASKLSAKERQQKAIMFAEQLTNCKQILSLITAAGGVMRAESGSCMMLEAFLKQVIERWQKRRPEAMIYIAMPEVIPAVKMLGEIALEQAIHNLLDNAADASPEHITLEIQCMANKLTMTICDKGQGLSASIQEQLGQPGYTTKHTGMGLGIFLAKSIIARWEGTLDIANAQGGGAVATIHLPLERLSL
jgi:two-component system sensor histidine kinase RegB